MAGPGQPLGELNPITKQAGDLAKKTSEVANTVADMSVENERIQKVTNFLNSFGKQRAQTPGRAQVLLGAQDIQLLEPKKTKVTPLTFMGADTGLTRDQILGVSSNG